MDQIAMLDRLADIAERFDGIAGACKANAPNAERLCVMRQNPADNFRWSKSCGALSRADIEVIAEALRALHRVYSALDRCEPRPPSPTPSLQRVGR